MAELEDRQITRAVLARVLTLHERAYAALMALGREALRDPAVLSREAEDALTDARRAGAWLREHGGCSDVAPRDHDALGAKGHRAGTQQLRPQKVVEEIAEDHLAA